MSAPDLNAIRARAEETLAEIEAFEDLRMDFPVECWREHAEHVLALLALVEQQQKAMRAGHIGEAHKAEYALAALARLVAERDEARAEAGLARDLGTEFHSAANERAEAAEAEAAELRAALETVAGWDADTAARHGHVGVREYARAQLDAAEGVRADVVGAPAGSPEGTTSR